MSIDRFRYGLPAAEWLENAKKNSISDAEGIRIREEKIKQEIAKREEANMLARERRAAGHYDPLTEARRLEQEIEALRKVPALKVVCIGWPYIDAPQFQLLIITDFLDEESFPRWQDAPALVDFNKYCREAPYIQSVVHWPTYLVYDYTDEELMKSVYMETDLVLIRSVRLR